MEVKIGTFMPRKQANKTRKRTGKDLDQIQEDFRPEKYARLIKQPVDVDLPGDGQFYCVECSRYFIDAPTLCKHKNNKLHKKRIKELQRPAYTQAEAYAAAGLGW